MDKNRELNERIINNLELINKQLSELLAMGNRSNIGYDYVNATQLAEILGESIKTIYARVHQKQIPYYKPGGKLLLFKMEEIKKWVKEGRYSTIDELKQIV